MVAEGGTPGTCARPRPVGREGAYRGHCGVCASEGWASLRGHSSGPCSPRAGRLHLCGTSGPGRPSLSCHGCGWETWAVDTGVTVRLESRVFCRAGPADTLSAFSFPGVVSAVPMRESHASL